MVAGRAGDRPAAAPAGGDADARGRDGCSTSCLAGRRARRSVRPRSTIPRRRAGWTGTRAALPPFRLHRHAPRASSGSAGHSWRGPPLARCPGRSGSADARAARARETSARGLRRCCTSPTTSAATDRTNGSAGSPGAQAGARPRGDEQACRLAEQALGLALDIDPEPAYHHPGRASLGVSSS